MAINGDGDARMYARERDFPAGESGILQRVSNALNAVDSTREPADAWVMTYMDLIALMLTLFVLLLSYSQGSGTGYQQVTRAMAEATGGGRSVIGKGTVSVKQPSGDVVLQDMSRDLQQQLDAAGLGGNVALQLKEKQLDIQLNEKILFASGEAALTRDAFRALDPIVNVFRDQGYSITVEGHTDNVPIANEQFPSNWELSVARAAYVVRYLIARGIDANRLKAVGYADTRPLASNNTVEGRRANRRVTLVIHQKGATDTSTGE